MLYGDALPVTSAFGPDAVCTEYERDSGGGWRCDTALVNSAKLPVHAPARYAGPCAHLKVVDERWICLGNVPGPMRAPEAPSVNS